VRQQLGKFEMAAGGTLFLDEIGDLRLDLQAKLLRAIQEGEIERVGGTKPIRTEFRLVVATHVDLERAIREGRFREDSLPDPRHPDPDAGAARASRGPAGAHRLLRPPHNARFHKT
jgi:transcriptional regulator with AAA-type ATPase domain